MLKKELANLLCWFRLLVGMAMFVLPIHPAVAILYSLAFLSDLADGYCCRRFGVNQHWFSRLPITMDPIADFVLAVGGLGYFFRPSIIIGLVAIAVVLIAVVLWNIGITHARTSKNSRQEAILSTSLTWVWFAIMVLALLLVWMASVSAPICFVAFYLTMAVFYAVLTQIGDETRVVRSDSSDRVLRLIKRNDSYTRLSFKNGNWQKVYYIVPGMASAPYQEWQAFANQLDGDVYVLHNYWHWSPRVATRAIEKHARQLGKQRVTVIGFSLGTHTYFSDPKINVVSVAPCFRSTLSIGPQWLRWLCGLLIRLVRYLFWPIILIAWYKPHGEWRNLGWTLDQLSDVLMSNHWNANPTGVVLFRKDEFLKERGNAFVKAFCDEHKIPCVTIDTSLTDNGHKCPDDIFCHCNLQLSGKRIAEAVKAFVQPRA